MNSITHKSILFYYDGPQVIEAIDSIGGTYIGVLVDSEDGEDQFLIAGVSPQRLRRFRVGSIDLRPLFLYLDIEPWFLGKFGDHGTINIVPGDRPLTETGFLPGEGFFLRPVAPATEVALEEARARNNFVFEVSIEPREAHTQHKVRSQTLVDLLAILQGIVKYAYGRSFPDGRRAHQRTDAHLFDVVVPAAAGSFRIIMEAAADPDLFGGNDIQRAFEVIDTLFANVGDPEAAAAAVRDYRGHLAGAFLRLLRFLSENDTGFSYSWALPNFSSSRAKAINRTETSPLLRLLERTTNLSQEIFDITGVLDRGSRDGKVWKLVTEDGPISGTIKRGGPSLEGLQFGARYRFRIQEEIVVAEGSGREQKSHYLLEHHPEP